MKTTLSIKKNSMITLIASLILACGAETVIATVFIPAFAAEWSVSGDPDYFIDLRPDDSDKSESGEFTGTEIHFSDSFRDNNPITGSFNGLDIEFTIERTDPVTHESLLVNYIGKMTPVSDTNHQIIRIELTSSEGDLILGE